MSAKVAKANSLRYGLQRSGHCIKHVQKFFNEKFILSIEIYIHLIFIVIVKSIQRVSINFFAVRANA